MAQQTLSPIHETGPAPASTPALRTIAWGDIRAALSAGLEDFRAAPAFGLFFGSFYALGGVLIVACLFFAGLPYLAYPLAAGYALLGPFAAAGLYGVMSFSVTQRTREMGVRSALGARGAQLVALVMRRSVVQLAIGLAIGLALALLASGALQPVLYRVDPRDAGVFGAVIVTLAFASLIASFLPARRVTRIDPVVALRAE